MRPPSLQELVEIFERCRGVFNTLDVSVLAYREGVFFLVLSARLTLGRVDHRPESISVMRSDWFVIRQHRPAEDFYTLIDSIQAGNTLDRLFNEQPGKLTFSQPPKGWFTNSIRRTNDSLFGPSGVVMQVGATWAPLFSS